MSIPGQPRPAKVLVGLLMKDRALFQPAIESLTDGLGPIDFIGPWWQFNYTAYYRAEMGTPLFRRMIAYKHLMGQECLADIKVFCNQIEDRFRQSDRRRINIDPGYLSQERLVLATGKNFAHRIYLREGIFADLTLIYRRGRFQALPWTYPDYADQPLIGFLTKARRKYVWDLQTGMPVHSPSGFVVP
jgi:hypothetical protein